MNKQFISIANYIILPLALCIILSCKKEHLQPDPLPGNPQPLVYISALMDSDSVYFAGGLNSYVGSTSVNDVQHFRVFNFTLKDHKNPNHSYFQFSINNCKNMQGDIQSDLDNSIYKDKRNYQDTSHFVPLAATLIWFNSAGVKFSSNLSQQSKPFSIASVEDIVFENKNYKKTTVEFECNLKAINGHVLHLTKGRAIILFGVN